MNRNGEVSSPPSPDENEDGAEFELVTRKKRGKRKNKNLSLTYFSKRDSGQTSDSYADSNGETGDSENTVLDNVIYGVRIVDEGETVDDAEYENTSVGRISWDGKMKAPPKVLELESPKPESFTNKEPKEFETSSSVSPQSIEPIKYNTRALSKHAVTYEMEKFKKNALLILNHINVDGYKPRLGTAKDVAELERTFNAFGFEVDVKPDLTKAQIIDELQKFGDKDYTDYGCVAVAVLTHGSKHGLIRAKDRQYSELEILNHLKVDCRPTLVTKPRLVIIQACRGDEDTAGIPVFQTRTTIKKDLDGDVEPYTLPVESDMLILHSSYIGKPSHRDEILGSWFIQSLCKKINQLSSTHDLESIITEVKREVAIDRSYAEHNRRTFEIDIHKQMPVSTSTLIRKLYLKRFNDEPPPMIDPQLTNSSQVSTHNVLDNGSPNTPLYVQFGPCSCFLQHFNYMRDCLRYYLEEHPDDVTAQSYLDVASTLEDNVDFNATKERMLKAISAHLKRTSDYQYSKYLYFYKLPLN